WQHIQVRNAFPDQSIVKEPASGFVPVCVRMVMAQRMTMPCFLMTPFRMPGGHLREPARAMRQNPTPSERKAWALLRGRRCLGLKFRRQHIISGFIVDFYCARLRVAIEVDGPIHDDPLKAVQDEERSQALGRARVTVVRIRNDELNAASLIDLLTQFTRNSNHVPPPRGGGQMQRSH